MITSKIIISINELYRKIIVPTIYFDLDNTLITSIFTRLEPMPYMKFYKTGDCEDYRYSIVRPGVKNF